MTEKAVASNPPFTSASASTPAAAKRAKAVGRGPLLRADEPAGANPAAPAETSAADYATFIGVARSFTGRITPMRADLQLALFNVKRGVTSILEVSDRLARLPETVMSELAELPNVVHATIYADLLIRRRADPSGTPGLISHGHRTRKRLLTFARGLAGSGLLSAERVAQITSGTGPINMAQDCLALARLYRENAAALAGKHPITDAELTDAATTGHALLDVLKPTRAIRMPKSFDPLTDDRDRLWTLVVRRHDALRRAATYLFGEAGLGSRVPPLLSCRTGPRRARPGASSAELEESAAKPA